MAVYMSGALRGSAAASRRSKLLSDIADAGVIEFAGMTMAPGRNTAQYMVRPADEAAEWMLMDGKELLPWLLGITHGLALAGDERSVFLSGLLRPFGEGADPVPADALAAALDAARGA